MKILLDECIPASAFKALRDKGFDADLVLDHLLPNSEDTLVAATADAMGALIVSHDRDFKRIISQRPDGEIKQYKNAHLIKMECKHARIGGRLIQVMPLLRAEFSERADMRDRRLIAFVSTDFVRIWR